jgi:hypothetical protein
MSSSKTSAAMAAMLGLALLSASCVAAPTAPPGAQAESSGQETQAPAATAPASQALTTQAPAATAPASQAPGIGDCYTASTGQKLRLTNSVVELSKMADLVVVGKVAAVTETRWATGNGKEPIRTQGQIPSVHDVYRLATFQVSRVGKAGPQAAVSIAGRSEIAVRVEGGQIGCKKFVTEDEPSLDVGQEVAVFLLAPADPTGVKLPGDFAVMWPWWIYKGEVLVPGSQATLSIDDFIKQSLSA